MVSFIGVESSEFRLQASNITATRSVCTYMICAPLFVEEPPCARLLAVVTLKPGI